MQRWHDESIDNIKRKCIERLSVKRKISFYSDDVNKIKTDYHQGLIDGKQITEDACYYFFTYSYNSLIQREVENAVREIKKHYENLIQQMHIKGQSQYDYLEEKP